jgi:phosphoribosylamine--glycine ligase
MIDVCQGIIDGNLKKVDFENKSSVCKYIVPEGYPETKHSNEKIEVDEAKIKDLGAKIFYAAVTQNAGEVYTTSSRAIGIVGSAKSLKESEEIAEAACGYVKGNLYHRKDIGHRFIS